MGWRKQQKGGRLYRRADECLSTNNEEDIIQIVASFEFHNDRVLLRFSLIDQSKVSGLVVKMPITRSDLWHIDQASICIFSFG